MKVRNKMDNFTWIIENSNKPIQYNLALMYLKQYVSETGIYKFPKTMLTDKKDKYFTYDGHMNIGEQKKSKIYDEILSTYWMWLIEK
jgi:NAD(P)H-dependent FMN reductase